MKRLLTLALVALVLGNCSARRPPAQEAGAQARAAMRSGDLATAREQYEAALRANPKEAASQIGLLTVLRETGAYEEAIRRGSAFAAAGDSTGLSLEIARSAAALGRIPEAEKLLRKARASVGSRGGTASAEVERALGDLLAATGRHDEAVQIWQTMIDRYRRGPVEGSRALGSVAVAAWRLGFVRDAKEIFMDATDTKTIPEVSAEVLNDFGHLFLEKYNAADALGCFSDSLKISANSAGALLGIALAKKYENTAEVENYARAALKVNPNLVPAVSLLAELRYQEEDYPAGLIEVRRALAVNPKDLEALSLQAVYHMVRGESAELAEVEKTILQIDPAYGRLYYALAENLVMRRKYREAVEQYRKAAALDAALWPAYAGMGINLMRIGNLEEGRAALQKTFEGDPFNVWAYNTLDLLDQMGKFARVERRNFVFLMSSEDEPILGPYLANLAEEAYDSMSRRYRFTPKSPVQIEVFPDHGGFAVRTLGLPGLGALGVCFGQVVAMDSSRAQKQGVFNWGSTFWHEFAHVITLQMTNHNIPRWFSEGISVYEERRGRTGWGDDLTAGFVRAYKEGRLLKVRELNAGLMRPKYPEQIAHSYYQASLFCEMIEEKFGFEKIRQSLELFARNKTADEVFLQALGWEPETLEQEYARFLGRRLQGVASKLEFPEPREGGAPDRAQPPSRGELAARLEKNPDDFFANLQMGLLLRKDGAGQAAESHLKKAQSVFPEFVETGNPYQVLSEYYLAQGREEQALPELLGWARYDENASRPLLRAAEIYRQRKDWVSAAQCLKRAVFAYPYDADTHRMLGDVSAQAGDWPAAVTAYQARIGMNPPDMAGACYDLAAAWLASGNRQEARRAVLRSLEIAPSFEKAQQLLLKLREIGR